MKKSLILVFCVILIMLVSAYGFQIQKTGEAIEDITSVTEINTDSKTKLPTLYTVWRRVLRLQRQVNSFKDIFVKIQTYNEDMAALNETISSLQERIDVLEEVGNIVYINGPGCPEEPLNLPDTYYRLSGDLTTSGDCIIIEADGITVDLGGNTISGDGTGVGITVQFWDYILIKDGTVTNFVTPFNIQSLTTVVDNVGTG